MNDKAEVPIN